MSDRRVLDESLDGYDEDLSALLDGELPAAREAELRALMTTRPELAARYAELSQLSSQLRDLGVAEVPQEQLDRLRDGVDRRVASWQSPPLASAEDVLAEASDCQPAHEPRADVIVLPVVRRYLAPAAALLAAGLALYLATGRSPSPSPSTLESADDRVVQGRAETPERSPSELASLSEEELAIAFEYEVLTDFEVIEQLELLELLSDLDSLEAM